MQKKLQAYLQLQSFFNSVDLKNCQNVVNWIKKYAGNILRSDESEWAEKRIEIEFNHNYIDLEFTFGAISFYILDLYLESVADGMNADLNSPLVIAEYQKHFREIAAKLQTDPKMEALLKYVSQNPHITSVSISVIEDVPNTNLLLYEASKQCDIAFKIANFYKIRKQLLSISPEFEQDLKIKELAELIYGKSN